MKLNIQLLARPHVGMPQVAVVAALIATILMMGGGPARAADPPPSPPAPFAPNLIENPSFEQPDPTRVDHPARWATVEGASNAYSASGGHTGPHYVGSALAGRATQQGCDLPNSNWWTEGNIPVDARNSYTLSFWTRSFLVSPTAHDMPVAGFQFFDAAGTEIGSTATDRGPVDLSEWVMLSYTVGTAGIAWPPSTASVRISLGGAGWDYGATCVEQQVYALQAFDDVAFGEGGVSLPTTGHGPSPTGEDPLAFAVTLVSLAIAGISVASIGFSSRANR